MKTESIVIGAIAAAVALDYLRGVKYTQNQVLAGSAGLIAMFIVFKNQQDKAGPLERQRLHL